MTLTPRHLATLQAALQFWREEMGPHGLAAMQPYFEAATVVPLENEEFTALDSLLKSNLRYAICDSSRERLEGTELFQELDEAQWAAGTLPVAALLIPLSPA